jgi:hypothetical protein
LSSCRYVLLLGIADRRFWIPQSDTPLVVCVCQICKVDCSPSLVLFFLSCLVLPSSSFSFSSRARKKKRKKKGQSRREGEDKGRQKDISLSLGLLPFSLFLILFFPKKSKREEDEEREGGRGEEREKGMGKRERRDNSLFSSFSLFLFTLGRRESSMMATSTFRPGSPTGRSSRGARPTYRCSEAYRYIREGPSREERKEVITEREGM